MANQEAYKISYVVRPFALRITTYETRPNTLVGKGASATNRPGPTCT